MNARIGADLKGMISVHYTKLLGHVIIMRTSSFDTDFVSQMKLAKLPLIHILENPFRQCFEFSVCLE